MAAYEAAGLSYDTKFDLKQTLDLKEDLRNFKLIFPECRAK